jgi:ketol-acid reductoisomerase
MKKLAIIGFGNQAKAWALNLRDSGWEINIGLRPNSHSHELASRLTFKTFDYTKPNSHYLFAILTPDETHQDVVTSLYDIYKSDVNKNDINKNLSFIYAHGFSLHYTDLKFFDCNHILLAPKAIASELRYEYETQGKNGGVYSFEYLKDLSIKEDILSLAKDLGLTSLHEASIADETIADLFSEQTLLCSTLPYAAVHSFNKLRQKGISQEVAFFECWHEVKLIANTMVKLGPEKFFDLISPNALIGSEIGKSSLFNDEYNKKLDDILEHIISGNFKLDLESTKLQVIKDDVLTFWKSQELTQVHKRLQQELY